MVKSLEKGSASNCQPSRETKQPSSQIAEMLTPSELRSLRQKAREGSAYAKKAFEHLRPKGPKT